MMQLKLFELFDTDKTLKELNILFGEQSVIKFSNSIIGITYDYSTNNYIKVLQKVKDLNMRQVIVTSSVFLNVIDYSVKHDLFINDLKFIYPISKEKISYVDKYIELINSTSGLEKDSYKTKLLKEIDWIISDKSIDIKNITIQMQNDDSPIYYNFELYNNGVLLIDDDSILMSATNLMNNILS
ncbi:hypothetical protein [Neobacillus sp. PS3-40]|uniref:hypothetical protein n=1 Tax=Neobacillus sp. PS3-40 TaxID=3070679 RepID=UPI0027E0D579|nr:hypothetical protein [Neobacillus sp. PS3-40]WML43132.1 hypothetical protein RCG20_15155 [Neobacillus sp. PS3-40]